MRIKLQQNRRLFKQILIKRQLLLQKKQLMRRLLLKLKSLQIQKLQPNY